MKANGAGVLTITCTTATGDIPNRTTGLMELQMKTVQCYIKHLAFIGMTSLVIVLCHLCANIMTPRIGHEYYEKC